jgi:chorismate dehydratase
MQNGKRAPRRRFSVFFWKAMAYSGRRAEEIAMLKLGCVPYLNARPLVISLETDPGVSLAYEPPSRLADELAAGRFDAALLPVVDFFRDDRFHLVPGVAIGSRGRIVSVRLFHKKPIPECRFIGLDRHSATSNALLEVLLRTRFGLAPVLETADPSTGSLHRAALDAFLTIGDASFFPAYQAIDALDLGEAWEDWQHLPFVYAAWVTARPDGLGDLAARLGAARDAGLARTDAIAEDAAHRFRLGVSFTREYLTRLVRYDLGKEEEAGMLRFNALAHALGLCPRRETIREYKA